MVAPTVPNTGSEPCLWYRVKRYLRSKWEHKNYPITSWLAFLFEERGTFSRTHHTFHHCYPWSLAWTQAPAHHQRHVSSGASTVTHPPHCLTPHPDLFLCPQEPLFHGEQSFQEPSASTRMLPSPTSKPYPPLRRSFPSSWHHAPVWLKAQGWGRSFLYCYFQTPSGIFHESLLLWAHFSHLPPHRSSLPILQFILHNSHLFSFVKSTSRVLTHRVRVQGPLFLFSIPSITLRWLFENFSMIHFMNFSRFNVCCSVPLWSLWSVSDVFLLWNIYLSLSPLCWIHWEAMPLHGFSALVRKACPFSCRHS